VIPGKSWWRSRFSNRHCWISRLY